MTRERSNGEEKKSRSQRVKEWIKGGVPSQITVTPTLAITVSFSLAVTFAISVYGIVTLIFQDTGWEVTEAQASTAYTVLMSQDVIIEENLEVKKNLMVQDDLQILGSVLDLASSSCDEEGLAPPDIVRLCFEQADNRLKASASGGDYVDLLRSEGLPDLPTTLRGPPGPQGLPGVQGPPGRDGLNCWDLNGNGAPDPLEDANRDNQVNVLDCWAISSASGISSATGSDGLSCWDLDGDGIRDTREDVNRDFQWNALDCQGTRGLQGFPGPAGRDGISCWDLNSNGIRDRTEDTNGDGTFDAQDCQPTASAMWGVVDLPPRQECQQVQLSDSILNAINKDARLITVQLTSREEWRPVYFRVRIPLVFICDQDALGSVAVDYDIRVVSEP